MRRPCEDLVQEFFLEDKEFHTFILFNNYYYLELGVQKSCFFTTDSNPPESYAFFKITFNTQKRPTLVLSHLYCTLSLFL